MDLMLHQERLFSLRARLRGEMVQMEDHALSNAASKTGGVPSHITELASDNFDQEVTLSLLGNEKEVLEQIDEALERIEDGSFGRCEDCDLAIPEPRLEAIPYTSLCVQCASQREKGEEPW